MKRRSILIIVLACVLCLSLIAACACKDKIDPNEQSLSIANAADLMGKWNVGEADRTVEVTLSDGLKDKQVVVTAEPEGVISVDGTTLHAQKAGTATVTATVVLDEEHSFSDSVEIKVTYNYTLQITNKSELTKAFRLGEADKAVQVKLSEAIKDNPVTVTSSDNSIVSVVDGKIHAVKKGEATITATSELNGVKFSDSFKVKVWGAFDLVVNNKTALEQPIGKYSDPVAIDYSLVEAGDYTSKDVSITSSKVDVAKIENGAIVPVGTGNTVVSVACGGKKVDINVTIEVLAELKLAEFDETKIYYTGSGEGDGCVLPEVVLAMNSLEQDVKGNVEITADSGLTLSVDKTKVYANGIGKYTVTYAFSDVEGKPDKQVSLVVTFVDELFSVTGAHAGNNKENEALANAQLKSELTGEAGSYKQVTTVGTDSLFFAKLNGSASKLYYAEAIIAVPNSGSDCDATIALAHFSSANERYALMSKLASNSGDFLNIDITFNKTDNVSKNPAAENGQTRMFMYKLLVTRHIDKLDGDTAPDHSTNLIKLGIARDGDYFYTFVNGQYVNCVTPANLRGEDTVPAIVGKWFKKGEATITDVNYMFEASDVRTKLDDLLGVNREKMIVPYSGRDDKATGTYQDSFKNTITTEGITDRGLGFNYANASANNHQNKSVISPNVWFEGNFTFSWDYKLSNFSNYTQSVSSGNKYTLILEARDQNNYDNDSLNIGAKYADDSGTAFADNTVKLFFDGNQSGHSNSTGTYYDVSTQNAVRFTLTRVIKGNTVTAIMTATVLDESGNPTDTTYTKIQTITRSNMEKPVILLWHSMGLDGQFSNVQWQLLPDDIDVSALASATEATNVTLAKEDTSYEVDGEQKETVLNKFNYSVDKLSSNALFNLGEQLPAGEYCVKVLATSNISASSTTSLEVYSKIITVAEGAQYLQLDATLGHGKYEVQLIRIPEPDPVKIVNKDDLQQKWTLGDEDRTIELKLGNGVEAADVKITSSDDTIVAVDGTTLKALKAGRVTITVTVGEGDNAYTDTVELVVHYNYSLAISNKDALTATYRVGDEDRTVATTFTDGVEGVNVVITSSNDEIISIVEGKLHALAKGEVTITATVTIDADNVFTDTVVVKVWGALDVTIKNADELAEPLGISDEPRAIELELVEAGHLTLQDVTITSSDEAVVKIENNALVPVSAGTATVTIAVGGVEKTVSVTVVNAILEIATDAVTHYVDEQFDIPAIVKATDDQGVDKTELVKIEASDGLVLSDGNAKASAAAIGEYTLTYSLKIGDYEPVTRVVTVTVIEDLFGASGAHVGDNQADADLAPANVASSLKKTDDGYVQQSTFGTDSLAFAQLKGAQASKFYYAEATFDIVTVKPASGDVSIALGHFLTGANDRHALLSVLNVNSSDYVGLDVTFNNVGNVQKSKAEANGQEYVFGYKIFKSRNFNTEQQQTQHVTIAIARDGDYFYTFVDGHYLNCVTFKDFRSEATLPAIVGTNFDSGDVQVSGITYLESDEAQAKLYATDGLLGANKEKMLVPFVNTYDGGTPSGNNYGNAHNGKTEIVTNVENAENRGLYFDYNNNGNGRYDSAVSPYVYLDGNFTFQWEYEFVGTISDTTSSDTTDNYRSILEFKDASLPTTNVAVAQLGTGTDSLSADANQELEFNTKCFKKANGYVQWAQVKGSNVQSNPVVRGTKIRFTATRILKEDHAEYILTAVVLDGSNTTYTRIIQYGNVPDDNMANANNISAQKNWAKSVIPYWCNARCSGKFSNITWTLLPDDATAAEFVEEGTGAATVSEGSFTCNNLIAKSVTLDLGENALEAGEYTVSVAVSKAGKDFATTDLASCEIYSTTLTVGANARYLKLSDIALGHGSYTITFTKVETPAPTPEVTE